MWIRDDGARLFKVVIYGAHDASVRGCMRAMAEKITGMPFAPPLKGGPITHDSFEVSLGKVKNRQTELLLTSAPAEGAPPAARLLILKQLDGAIFVSSGKATEADRTSFAELRALLEQLGYPVDEIPVVVQLEGWCDSVPDALEKLGATGRTAAQVDTVAGKNVLDGLKALSKLLLEKAPR
ncbi:MAG: hypothetical protein JST54_35085 [Deltaproteobacteria bacterium]|nr:hypothetical protein [Deltaproteobacteria bacterium]